LHAGGRDGWSGGLRGAETGCSSGWSSPMPESSDCRSLKVLWHRHAALPGPEPQNKRNWPNPKVRPSLNREASRLGDVRVRRPSFRAQVPETHSERTAPETLGELSIAQGEISRFTRIFTHGNSSCLGCKNRNAVAGPQNTRVNSPQSGLAQSAFGNFAQQKIAEHADPLRRAQLFRIDEIGLVRRPRQLRQDAHQARVLGRDKVGQRG